ncbi:hypothetical protein CAEBREN_16342 [Caenorhabditis brenneri]|uniref:Uncharacterized protein n=1 Tax=Caenorhabditis brenneri TaxID=135651 RepID=G0N046_CAEBE|nr:hypothetical protein CAEBREN_16342 [Caenorhabditis brenneri]
MLVGALRNPMGTVITANTSYPTAKEAFKISSVVRQ